MGFGLLFIGYFLLLNLTYYGYTDLIAALVMFMAFYKLASVNKYFRFALLPTGLFAVIGIVELIEAALSTFGFNLGFLIEYTAASRYLLIGFLTIFMLMGIEDIADEVDVKDLSKKAKYSLPFAYLLFSLGSIFEFPSVGNLFPVKTVNVIAVFLLLAIFIFMAVNLFTVYSAYMHICMPEDINNDVKDTPSRFGFVNKFKEHENEKNREYAEYKINKAIKKAEKKKRKK